MHGEIGIGMGNAAKVGVGEYTDSGIGPFKLEYNVGFTTLWTDDTTFKCVSHLETWLVMARPGERRYGQKPDDY